MSLDEAVLTGMTLRLRPVLMTAVVVLMALLFLLLASGRGPEMQRPLAPRLFLPIICPFRNHFQYTCPYTGDGVPRITASARLMTPTLLLP